MKQYCLTVVALALLTSPLAAQPAAQPGAKPATLPPPTTLKDRASYSIGINIGQSLKSDGIDVNPMVLARGIIDAIAGNKPALSMEQMRQALTELQQQAKQQDIAFLAANAKKEGVKVLPSGLQYKVLKSGSGPSPKLTDKVRTHYHGTLINGKVFDSSVQRNEPAEFPVNGVIAGWTEALQLMKVGDKWQLVVPSDLAYGKRGSPGGIAPDTTLIFEVELLGIVN